MALHDMLSAEDILNALGCDVTRLVTDSREVKPGDTFVAYPGEKLDGRDFVARALANGAGSVLWEARGGRDWQWRSEWRVPHASVPGLKARLGELADLVYGQPSRHMWLVGVTGTNGKTSCAHWVARGLSAAGRRCGVLGTLGNGFPDALKPALNTTPDAADLHATLAALRQQGAVAAAMEVSSHGLVQHRVDAITFDVALFTNLTRDHLDYHGTLSAYGEAKARLIEWPTLSQAVINADDDFGRQLIRRRAIKELPCLSFGFGAGQIRGDRLSAGRAGLEFDVSTPWGSGHVKSSLIGSFNALNLLGVMGVLLASGIDFCEVLHAVPRFVPVAGRMQRVGGAGSPLVAVDYAHTPDALEKALLALRPFVAEPGRLVCVFGCGGDRDAGKRPEMGAVAVRFADQVVVTSDNPRSEDPEQIITDIMRGIPKPKRFRARIEVDRAQAIVGAVRSALAEDVILLAGKGHETCQEVGGVRHPFDDLEHARRALQDWVSAP